MYVTCLPIVCGSTDNIEIGSCVVTAIHSMSITGLSYEPLYCPDALAYLLDGVCVCVLCDVFLLSCLMLL